MDLTPTERKLAALLLNLAADQFSDHGCNDFSLRKDGDLSDAEVEEMLVGLRQGMDPDYGARGLVDDWLLMRYLAKRLSP